LEYVCDIEANGLDNPTVVWCVVLREVASGKVHRFDYRTGYDSLKDMLGKATRVIGHNFIGYDEAVMDRLLGIKLASNVVYDTLVVSRLYKFNLDGGHSLENWGRLLGKPKVGLDIDFSKFSEEMIDRCEIDTEINLLVYKFLLQRIEGKGFDEAISIEHSCARICRDMHINGFAFDVENARKLRSNLEERVLELEQVISRDFPPRAKLIREYTPRLTKHGTISRTSVPRGWTDLTQLSGDAPFSLVEWEPFNPGSPKQVVERLNEFGWRPVERTVGHIEALKTKESPERLEHYKRVGWKVNETNLATLPESAPEGARKLVHWLMLTSRVRKLKEWIALVREDGRVHGRFNFIGTWTHRMSHSNPNMGNVSAKKSIKYKAKDLYDSAVTLGAQMRALWKASEGWWLVGTDMDGAHLRILAHYMDDPKFTEALVNGRKEDGTDPHSLNKTLLGSVCNSRDTAKTFIFAWLLGAGHQKISEIFGCSVSEAKRASENFIEGYPGLKRLKEVVIPGHAAKGYFPGLDGRLVICDDEHLILAGMLQNGEAVIMKHANELWRSELEKHGIPYRQVNFVHDEWQTEVRGPRCLAGAVGLIQSRAIRRTGERFGLKCPLAGTYSTGKNWLETH
jgi:DNA polymerase-1